MADTTTTVAELKELVQRFVAERDWMRFHAPKNVAMGIAIEAAELMEHYQWIDAPASYAVTDDPAERAAVADELADVLAYVLALGNVLGIDLSEALAQKMIKNAIKYPAENYRGKYRLDPE